MIIKVNAVRAQKLEEKKYRVILTIGDVTEEAEPIPSCTFDTRENIVVAISSAVMGNGAEELGRTLLKGFIFALTQQEVLPQTLLFYNGGAALTCENSATLEDLKLLEAEGVEILTCGTCLNYYGLTDSLKVGEVTNMYTIAEKLTAADKIIKP